MRSRHDSSLSDNDVGQRAIVQMNPLATVVKVKGCFPGFPRISHRDVTDGRRQAAKEAILAVLQVNVRPALNARPHNGSQRGGQAGDFQTQFRNRSSGPPLPQTRLNDNEPFHPDVTNDLLTPVWQTVVWRLSPGATIGRALIAATERLRDAGSPTASLDAQVILAHALDVERSWLFAHYDHELTASEAERYTDFIARRAASEPVAYLVGHKEFYGLDLLVDRRVLIPRPETELLVDAVLEWIDDYCTPDSGADPVLVADIGTGSGAIALAMAAETPNAQVYATDISADALEVARRNAERLNLDQRVTFYQGDMLTPLPEPVDILVANLPYVPKDEYQTLDADVHDYEPQVALESGPEGLDAIRRLLTQAPGNLRSGGLIVLEIGHNQGEAVAALATALLPQAQWVSVEQDYSGHDRVVRILMP